MQENVVSTVIIVPKISDKEDPSRIQNMNQNITKNIGCERKNAKNTITIVIIL